MADRAIPLDSDSGRSVDPGTGATPMMAQYLEIKAANPGCLLFYRMGDFYELFFEDAETASRALGITLTRRGRHQGADIPMCGVPVHAADDYLQKLIRLGHRVAVCEQTEDPAAARKRSAKAVVRREVVRLVTPGTLTEDTLLDARANNFLTALFRAPSSTLADGETYALASLDISTGEFVVAETGAGDLAGELARLAPGEVILGEDMGGDKRLRQTIERTGAAVSFVPRPYFDGLSGERGLKARLGVATLDGFGAFSRPELAAVGALLKYVDITQVGRAAMLRPPRRSSPADILMIDQATRANLEFTRTLKGERRGSLLHAIDRTVTGAGARELAARLASPLRDQAAIARRLDAVALLIEDRDRRAALRQTLKAAPDLARALGRLALQRGGPRDLGAVRGGMASAAACARVLAGEPGNEALPPVLADIADRLAAAPAALAAELDAALADTLPVLARDGGFVRAGYRGDLDDNRLLRDQSRKVVAELQAKYVQATGVRSLKVRHNNVLGYFIEVTAANAETLSAETDFIHRQTLASAVRFTTRELAETEARINAAAEQALAIEMDVFRDLAARVTAAAAALSATAAALAELDCLAGLAEIADEQGYVRPKVDDSFAFDIEAGRHPVVEQAMAAAGDGPFVANDCVLVAGTEAASQDASGRIWLLTGPNMAGKSTFLRQNAIIAVLAQMGSFVPAARAHIGAIDRLFSRVGASDDLAGGRSTFMVEMIETAGILNQASARSFVILDEIGRGTATFDGLSIAWACVEHLHAVNRCRALFATHYHELTALAGTLANVVCATVQVKEWRDEIVFLHKVVRGAADRSYGIQVAKLAGLPASVIARAHEVLQHLERGEQHAASDLADDLPLFRAAPPPPHRSESSAAAALEAAVRELDPDALSPRQALEALYRLKALALDGDR